MDSRENETNGHPAKLPAWLMNQYDPSNPAARATLEGWLGKTPEGAWDLWTEDLHRLYVIGEPRATAKFTAEQLKAEGLVGLYKRDDS